MTAPKFDTATVAAMRESEAYKIQMAQNLADGDALVQTTKTVISGVLAVAAGLGLALAAVSIWAVHTDCVRNGYCPWKSDVSSIQRMV